VTAAGKVADADPGGESVMGSRTLFFPQDHVASKQQQQSVNSHSTVSHDGVQGFGAALLILRCSSLSSVPPCICQCLTST
jgi:hypothetical protein